MDANLLNFSKKLKKIRKSKNLTLEKLAEKVDVSPNHISKLESSRTYPSFQLISKLSFALNVKMQDFFDFDEVENVEYIRKYLEDKIKQSGNESLNMMYKFSKIINL